MLTQHQALLRPTSACAESTLSLSPIGDSLAAHLRLRGEHVDPELAVEVTDGPPPPARRAPFATCAARGVLPIRDSRNAGHAPA